MLGKIKSKRAKSTKETKNQRHFYFSSSTTTLWCKVEATNALLGRFKIHTSDTNSTFNMESKTHQL